MTDQGATDRCHRCLQPVPANARRCPHCGDFQKVSSRRLTLYLAVLGMLAVLAIVGLGLFIKPEIVNLDNVPEAERVEKPAAPRPPAKKPPLN